MRHYSYDIEERGLYSVADLEDWYGRNIRQEECSKTVHFGFLTDNTRESQEDEIVRGLIMLGGGENNRLYRFTNMNANNVEKSWVSVPASKQHYVVCTCQVEEHVNAGGQTRYDLYYDFKEGNFSRSEIRGAYYVTGYSLTHFLDDTSDEEETSIPFEVQRLCYCMKCGLRIHNFLPPRVALHKR